MITRGNAAMISDGMRNDEAVDEAGADQEFDQRNEGDQRTEAERRGKRIAVCVSVQRRHRAVACAQLCAFLVLQPAVASSRRSLQICAT